MTNLKILKLNNTDIKELPKDFGNLNKLEELHIINADLRSLPNSFASLKSLRYLDLS